MKKTSILIAMFAVIAAASAAMAQAPVMDFDGKFKPQTMHNNLLSVHRIVFPGPGPDTDPTPIPIPPVPNPTPAPWPPNDDNTPIIKHTMISGQQEKEDSMAQSFIKLGKDQQLNLFAAFVQGNLFPRDVITLIGDLKTDILYNNTAVYFVSKSGNVYVTTLESTDKRLITLLCKTNTPTLHNKNAVVCKFVEMVLWELVKGVWTEVIRQVKQCSSDIDTDPIPNTGSGSTYHSGQGGSSNYDVNKLIQ